MDPVRIEWSLEDENMFDEAFRDINLEGPKCAEDLNQRFPEKPMYEIEDEFMKYITGNFCTENVEYQSYGEQLDSLFKEAAESDNFRLSGETTRESAVMPPLVCEDVGESSSKRKKIEAGDRIGNESEEATRKESKKGKPWTPEEHELFLRGLQKYGRGKWRMVCWEFLKTRTPIQVASHAQKYFDRLKIPSDKRQTSIHDIRLPNKSVAENTDIATLMSNYKIFTNSKCATPEGIANSNSATRNRNCWQFATGNHTTTNDYYGHFANNLAHGSVVGPCGSNPNICTEPTMPFEEQQQLFDPSIQDSSMFHFEDDILDVLGNM